MTNDWRCMTMDCMHWKKKKLLHNGIVKYCNVSIAAGVEETLPRVIHLYNITSDMEKWLPQKFWM